MIIFLQLFKLYHDEKQYKYKLIFYSNFLYYITIFFSSSPLSLLLNWLFKKFFFIISSLLYIIESNKIYNRKII